ncbi:MAG TPA: protein-L-isoaspartate(D-aspartate) O-methyltransferase [Candidatus Acidoferrum sp.]
MQHADEFGVARQAMVDAQLRRRGIRDESVLAAMNKVRREEFVPLDFRSRAYEDAPLPIGEGQTISQPYIVAAMTAALRLRGGERVLEVGAGCGYQAAILGCLAREVFTIEYRPELATGTAARLARLEYVNVHVHCGDGTMGLAELAPFDAILVAAGAPAIPEPLLKQLAEGGTMVAPVGDADSQELQLVQRRNGEIRVTTLEGCRFVPLVGRYGWKESSSR